MKSLLADKKGSVTMQTAIVVLAMMVLFSLVYVYAQLTAVASGVRNAVRNEAIKAVAANYFTAYNGMREGNTDAYALDDNDQWQSDIDPGSIEQGLTDTLNLNDSDGTLQKVSGNGALQYSISGLNVTAYNPDLATNNKRLSIHATYTLSVPVSFFLVKTPPVSIPMSADAQIEEKF